MIAELSSNGRLKGGAAVSAICFYFALLKSAFSQWSAALWFTIIFWLPTFVFIATTALIFWVLPRRNPRMAGKRRLRRVLIAVGPQVVKDQAGYLCGRLLCCVLPDSKRVQQGTAIQREVARRRAPLVCIAK